MIIFPFSQKDWWADNWISLFCGSKKKKKKKSGQYIRSFDFAPFLKVCLFQSIFENQKKSRTNKKKWRCFLSLCFLHFFGLNQFNKDGNLSVRMFIPRDLMYDQFEFFFFLKHFAFLMSKLFFFLNHKFDYLQIQSLQINYCILYNSILISCSFPFMFFLLIKKQRIIRIIWFLFVFHVIFFFFFKELGRSGSNLSKHFRINSLRSLRWWCFYLSQYWRTNSSNCSFEFNWITTDRAYSFQRWNC